MPTQLNQPIRQRRWPRRLAVAVLCTSLTALVLLAGFAGWVVWQTVPVVVVDDRGRPVSDVAVFDLDAAEARPVHQVWAVRSLHRFARPFGAALVWDWEWPVYTDGSGRARVPESQRVTAVSLGDLKRQSGEVYVAETTPGDPAAGTPTTIVLRQADQRFDAMDAALEKRVTWNFVNTPLRDIIKLVESAGIPVAVDRSVLEEEGVTLDTPFSLRVTEIPLGSALYLVLGHANLTFLSRTKSIRITSQLMAGSLPETRFYPIGDLLTASGEEIRVHAEELEDLLIQTVSPHSWTAVGGTGQAFVFAPERMLVVHQTQPVHDQIEWFLFLLRNDGQEPESDDERRIRLLWEHRVTFEFCETPLADVTDWLRELPDKPNIVLDRVALEEEGVSFDTPITLRVRDMRLDRALGLLLQQLNLTTIVWHDAILITSQLQPGCATRVRMYPVRDLVGNPPDFDELTNLARRMVAPNSWDTVGGVGSINRFTPKAYLVMHQTDAVHDQIRQFLASLRRGDNPPESAEQAAIRAALVQRVTCDFRSTPLGEAIREIQQQAGIKNIVLDRVSLEEEGVGIETPVTLRVCDMTAASALRHLLRHLEPATLYTPDGRVATGSARRRLLGQLQLPTIIQDDALVVTSQLTADNTLSLRIYPVGDLLGDPPKTDELNDLIHEIVAPDTWDWWGGPGSSELSTRGCYLVVNQTEAVHDALADCLAQLRGQPRPSNSVEDALRQTLNEPRTVKLDSVSLDRLANWLADDLGHNVLLDEVDLEKWGIKPDRVVTISAQNEPLGLALKRGLEEIDASFEVRDEALVIGGYHSIADHLRVRVYPVASLVRADEEGESLVEQVRTETRPATWASVGGAGAAVYFGPTRRLVVLQTDEVHAQVEAFLAKLVASLNHPAR